MTTPATTTVEAPATVDVEPLDTEVTQDPTTAPASPLATACAAGRVRVYRVRASGTVRRVRWLNGVDREHAEWLRMRVEDGVPWRTVADEASLSKSAVYRAVKTLSLIDEVEAGELDELYDEDTAELLVMGEDGEEE